MSYPFTVGKKIKTTQPRYITAGTQRPPRMNKTKPKNIAPTAQTHVKRKQVFRAEATGPKGLPEHFLLAGTPSNAPLRPTITHQIRPGTRARGQLSSRCDSFIRSNNNTTAVCVPPAVENAASESKKCCFWMEMRVALYPQRALSLSLARLLALSLSLPLCP